MQVFVTGSRSSHQDWLRAQQWPFEDVPPLNEEQRAVAKKLGISEEDYARSAYAGELSRHELSVKTERFGELLQAMMQKRLSDASVQTIELRTFDGKFQVVAIAGGREIRLQIDEELVDNLLGSGSQDLEARLTRIVDLSLPIAGAVRAS